MEPTLLSNANVWMEGNALAQLSRVAALPGCRKAVGMPDLHAGVRGPVGVALLFEDGPRPPLIGGDAGCGVLLLGLPRTRPGGLDALERRVREVTEEPALDLDPQELFRLAWTRGPRGLCGAEGVPEALSNLAAAGPKDDLPPSSTIPEMHGAGESLGTAGGGNHFLELGQVEHVRDRERSTSVGLVPGGLAVLAHTGSRSVGHHLADGWPEGPLRDGERDRWMGDLAGALRFAATNRLLLGWKMVRAVGGGRPGNVAGLLDIIHNTVVADDRGFLHRKGCAPAELDQLTVVLGSRGTHSHVMVGLGCEAGLCSVAHGAGRKMTRSEATQKIKSRYSRASLSRTALGSRVVCDDTALLYEEHPDAYKAIDPVISALEQHGAARRVAALRPLVTVKR